MTYLELAIEVWGHLGQPITSIKDNSKEANNFNKLVDTARRRVIYNTAPVPFIYPFKSNLLFNIQDEGNPFRNQFFVWSYPAELVQLLTDLESYAENFPFISRGYVSPAYDTSNKRRAIITREPNFTFLGLIDIQNLDHWGEQFLETLALYMAWMLAPVGGGSSGRDRERLQKEHARSEAKSKIYNNMETSNGRFNQRGSLSDVIEFGGDLYNPQFDYFTANRFI